MKTKILTLLIFSASLLGGCGQGNNSSTPTPTSSTPGEFTPEYLSFIDKGNIRIDLFSVDAQFSYGNAALAEAVNTQPLKAESKISVSAATSSETKYHFIFFAEKSTRFTSRYLSTSGDDLVNFFNLESVKKFFDDFDSERGYVAISTGTEALWTKGLNASFDRSVEGMIPTIPQS